MAFFAEINEENVVTRVLVTDDTMPNKGHDWLKASFGGVWVETDLYGTDPKLRAAIGFTYNAEENAFYPQHPFAGWIFNKEKHDWEPPIPYPDDGAAYSWSEEAQNWEPVPTEPTA